MKKVYVLTERHFDERRRIELAIVSEKEMNLEKIAELLGGQASEYHGDTGEPAVVFPETLFSPTKEGNEFFNPGELLEYRKGELHITRIPDDPFETALYVQEVPVMEVIE